MSIYVPHLRDCIIAPALKEIALYSKSAVSLLLGTAAKESNCGYYLKQLEGGPAAGIYQMEPTTFHSIIDDYLMYRPLLSGKVCKAVGVTDLGQLKFERLIYDLKLATIMCRLRYSWIPEELPKHDDIPGLAAYWKKYYNTKDGSGTITEFIENYERYVGS